MGNKIYIKFSEPSFKKEVKKETFFNKYLKSFISKSLSLFLPMANSDYEHLIDDVQEWKIEYDNTENCAWREIGFDKNGKVIMVMPFHNNYGYWTDNNLTLEDFKKFEYIEISATEFESEWNSYTKKFRTDSC